MEKLSVLTGGIAAGIKKQHAREWTDRTPRPTKPVPEKTTERLGGRIFGLVQPQYGTSAGLCRIKMG